MQFSQEIFAQSAAAEGGNSLLTQNKNNINYYNFEIVLANSVDLDWAQIAYAINYKRLIFINNYKTWTSFYVENNTQYNDYTPEELCHRFLKRVLPNIYEYELSEDELHLLNLLQLHPCFDRTESGFTTTEGVEKLTFPSNEAAITPLIRHSDPLNPMNFDGENVEYNNQILTTRKHDRFTLSAENAALVSVVLCPNEDLPNCELLTVEELLKRLKAERKRVHSDRGQLENINIPISVLFRKLETVIGLKDAVTKLVDKNCRTRDEF